MADAKTQSNKAPQNKARLNKEEQYDHCYHNFKVLEELTSRMEKLEDKYAEIDRNQGILQERFMGTLDRLTESLDSQMETNKKVQDGYIKLYEMQTALTKDLEYLQEKFQAGEERSEEQFRKINTKLGEVDNKSKIDIIELQRDDTKKKFSEILTQAGGIGGIAAILLMLVKTLSGS